MRTCAVCGNSSPKTKYTRPELVYHKFPSNTNLKKKWLDVLGLRHCTIYQSVCSDHFLEENYMPSTKKRYLIQNTIPQPCDKKYDQNGFPNNYTIQTNDVETSNNAVLPMVQNIIIKEEHIGNTVVNNFEAQRRSSRNIKYTRINDMHYYEYLPRPKIEKRQIPTVIKTEVQPVITSTKDCTLRYGRRCSVKICFNRYSKGLSFFGYPNNLKMRKKWLAKTGLVVDPTKIKLINHYKVCSVHFDNDCFKNIKFKNRLRPGSIPTLFVYEDTIDAGYIPSTSSPVNSGFVHVNDARNIPSTTLVPSVFPIPMNARRSASNARNNLPDNTDEGSNNSMSIDDFPTIETNFKEKNISANNSLSITLEPFENSKVIEPSVDLFTKTSAAIKTPVISKYCISLAKMTDEYYNLNSSCSITYTSTHTIIDNGNNKYFIEKNTFIFDISKRVELPSLLWEIKYFREENVTFFYEKDKFEKAVKIIFFFNNLVPIITLYDRSYKLDKPITTMNQLKNLLQQIDNIEKGSDIDKKMPNLKTFNFFNYITPII